MSRARPTPGCLFGKWLNKNLTDHGMTYKDLGDLIGRDHSSISRYIRGMYHPKYTTIIEICKVFPSDPQTIYRLVYEDRLQSEVKRWSACDQ